MRKKIAVLLITGGLAGAAWNGYAWATESSSGREALDTADIVMQEPEPEPEESAEAEAEPDESAELPTPAFDSPEPGEPRVYDEYDNGDDIGWLLIPAVDMKYPIYWGTDDETLKQGVGYHEGDFTVPPDGMGHTVLSGHRDTVFRELGELEDGDSMYIQFEGVQYEYEIDKTWITDAEDRTVIVDKEEPILTLTTCYPFTFIGPAPDRYIIEAPLVDTVPMEDE
ncbi:class D sortase [Bacillus daqingensis]|uniref:Class D sortase n=1 Tax=Bacillus daqingensis TaxID=872396 RepID=A0ABV9NVZ0_9BACI